MRSSLNGKFPVKKKVRGLASASAAPPSIICEPSEAATIGKADEDAIDTRYAAAPSTGDNESPRHFNSTPVVTTTTSTTVLQSDGSAALILQELAVLRAKVDQISNTQVHNHASVMKRIQKDDEQASVNLGTANSLRQQAAALNGGELNGGAKGSEKPPGWAWSARTTAPQPAQVSEDDGRSPRSPYQRQNCAEWSWLETQPLLQMEDEEDADVSREEYMKMCKKEELLRIVKLWENHQAKQAAVAEIRSRGYLQYLSYLHNTSSAAEWEIVVNTVMVFVISANALFIGLAIDNDTDSGFSPYVALNILFIMLYVGEYCILARLRGPRALFLGAGRSSAIFDITLVVIDAIQLCLRLAAPSEQDSGTGRQASMLRLIRLVKLARLTRLLRADIFKDLLCMIHGMMGGCSTLGWSMALFVLILYVCSLFFREFLGGQSVEHVSEYFDSVPRSMLTTFRCSFGDCNSVIGRPIFEDVHNQYGYWYSLIYCVFTFCCVVGLFNVISAIFVESTMMASASMDLARKKGRMNDDLRWAKAITTLLQRLVVVANRLHSEDYRKVGGIKSGAKKVSEKSCQGNAKELELNEHTVMSEEIDKIASLWVPAEYFDEVVKDPAAEKALAELDIDPSDNDYLDDILDPTNDGHISVLDLVDGLRRLRGAPRRSDIVTIDLMVREIQDSVEDILLLVKRQGKITTKLERSVSNRAFAQAGVQLLSSLNETRHPQ